MYVLNISSKVDHSIITEWIDWQKNIVIPSLMSTGLVNDSQFYKLLEHDDEEGALYILQLYFNYHQDLRVFADQYDTIFLKHENKKWGEQFISFKTTLKNIGK